MKASGGAERPERVNLQYVDDAFFAAQEAAEIGKELTLHDQDGKLLTLLMNWSKTEPWNREGRSRAGEASGAPAPPTKGYYAVRGELRPSAAKPRGSVERYDFLAEDHAPIQIIVRH